MKTSAEYFQDMLNQGLKHDSWEKALIAAVNGADLNFTSRSSQILALHKAIEDNRYDIVQTLVKLGSDVNAVHSNGGISESVTPLHLACFEKRVDIARLLLDNGAKIGAIDSSHDRTPLHFATTVTPKCNPLEIRETIDLLLSRGADPNVQDIKGNTPLHNLTNGFGFHSFNLEGMDSVRVLLKSGANPNLTNISMQTPLHNACLLKHDSLAAELVKHGSDPALVDNAGHSPVDIAGRQDTKGLKVLFSASRSKSKSPLR